MLAVLLYGAVDGFLRYRWKVTGASCCTRQARFSLRRDEEKGKY
jgi:hypothetical protein